MSRRSNRPQHHEALYFPHRRLWIMEYSCKVWYKPCRHRLIPRQHSRPSWRPRLVAFDHRTLDEALSTACRQEGEMEQYLEEKKASQKRPATSFQRQDKKKMVYQTQQKPVAVSNSQSLISCLASIDHAADTESAARDRRQVPLDRTVTCVVGDVAPLEETGETDSERGD
ncbi:hypothetical protein Taro_002435 [Colocasia esculenta]|uniref:Uncharacterized protein n=1 Tax=Colocasia esculenta TaxID=4460 RepID=A0A843TH92_COLES|nr:hypothetical protein [Colocasia esculenta]